MGIEMEKNAYEAKKSEKPVWENDEPEAVRTGVEIPKDLICPVCKDLLKVSCLTAVLDKRHCRMITYEESRLLCNYKMYITF